jgi:hypothetical protein
MTARPADPEELDVCQVDHERGRLLGELVAYGLSQNRTPEHVDLAADAQHGDTASELAVEHYGARRCRFVGHEMTKLLRFVCGARTGR